MNVGTRHKQFWSFRFTAWYIPFETNFLQCNILSSFFVARFVYNTVRAFSDFLGMVKII